MRIGIDCDGVLRDFIGHLIDHIKENHPEHSDKILTPTSWDWEDWLPFWTEEETEKYVFRDNYIDLFGVDCPPIQSSVDDWKKLKRWAEDEGHELVLVSAQREQTKEITDLWLEKYGFDFKEKHYTHKKHLVDVDVLIDDSPSKLGRFKKQSINNGSPICYKQPWNTKSQNSKMSIDRLSDIIGKVFG
tara:strand:- start:1597 stop:2160 length:564 start_codon:yes stop_codon:yes gene_type:complete